MATIHSRLVRKRGTTHKALLRSSELDASAPDRATRATFRVGGPEAGRAHVYERIVQIYDGVDVILVYDRATGKDQQLIPDEFYPHLIYPTVQRVLFLSLYGVLAK